MYQDLETFKVTRVARKQEQDRRRAVEIERERQIDRERDREREINRQIFHERKREKRREVEIQQELMKLRQERLASEAVDMDDDQGFYLPAAAERDDILPRLFQAVDSITRFIDVSTVAGYLTSMTRDLAQLQNFCLFAMAHPDRPLPWWMGYFSALPTEIQAHILSWTKIEDLWRVRCVCRIWNDLIQRECYWVNLLERDFSPIRNRLHNGPHFQKSAQWLYRSKRKHLAVRDHIVGEWIGRYWNKTTLALWEGEWKDGRILGYGSKSIPATGDFFEGRWHDERLCGFGRADTKTYHYLGEWKDHTRHGKGSCSWKHPAAGATVLFAQYDGDWQFDTMDGVGKMRYVNGDVYDGEWLDGMRDGLGTMLEVETGKEYRGIWERDTCQVAYDNDGQLM